MTRKYYTFKDLTERLRPGSFVYPYHGDNYVEYDNSVGASNKIAAEWAAKNKIVQKTKTFAYIKRMAVLSDVNIRTQLPLVLLKTKTFPTATAYYINNRDFSRLMWGDWRVETVQHPLPLGLYLGEVIQLLDGKTQRGEYYYAKVLTLSGDIVWVG